MPDDTLKTTVSTKSSTGHGTLRLILAVILSVLTLASGAVSAVTLPRMTKAQTADALTHLMSAVEHNLQAIAAEVNEIVLSVTTGVEPDEGRTNQSFHNLGDAAKKVSLKTLALPNDARGARAKELLQDPDSQLRPAREAARKGYFPDSVTFDDIVLSSWTIQQAVADALKERNSTIGDQALEFVKAYRDLPTPPLAIDNSDANTDPRASQIVAMTDVTSKDFSSARLIGYGTGGATLVLLIAAVVLWLLRARQTASPKPVKSAAQ
ncbi:MAG: hypothetical protein LBG70_00315, partial [Bifidobacteriaceae bacterium]|nr:hypothetical protein [Bifidobacteriaceae bacterium]